MTGLKLVDALLGRGANNLKIDGWKVRTNLINLKQGKYITF